MLWLMEDWACLSETVVAKMSDDERIEVSVEFAILHGLFWATVIHFWREREKPLIGRNLKP